MPDREKVIGHFQDAIAASGDENRWRFVRADIIEDALALLVVRCKDCKYCVKEPTGELYCDILAVGYEPLGSKKVNEDWYCADGERRVTQE